MKREEKIEIMFESILSEIEQLKTLKLKGSGKTPSESPEIWQMIQELRKEIFAIKIPSYEGQLERLERKIEVFFSSTSPGTLGELDFKSMEKKGKFITFLLIISVELNIYFIWKLFA